MNILEFLTKLDTNLTNSQNSFKQMDKKINNGNLNILSELIKKNNINLYTYLDLLKQLQTQYFLELDVEKEHVKSKPFVLSFDIDSTLYDKNFKNKFKQDNQIDINTHKLKLLTQLPHSDFSSTKNITILDSKDISPNSLNVPVVKDLKTLPPIFHWYDGDQFNKKGIYICMSKGFYCRVPFPNMMSSTDQNFKVNSIPCKHNTREACNERKVKIASIYGSDLRECSYVHKRERFTKIGSFYRCNRESFGNYDSLNEDMSYVNTNDIKRILMHSLSDALLSTLWYQNKFKDGNLMLNNLEIF